MALRFLCEHCKAVIIVNHLKVGESALCRACGKTATVPPDAVETAQVADYLSQAAVVSTEKTGSLPSAPLPFAGKKAWNPKGIHVLSWFFSPLPAGIVWALNYERLGHPEKKLGAFLIALLLTAAVVAISMIPNVPRFLLLLLNGSAASIYYYAQADLFRKFLEKGGSKASFLLPTVNSLALILVVFAVLYGISEHQEGVWMKRINEIDELLSNSRYTAAKARLSALKNDYPEQPAPHIGLAVVYLEQDRIDSALASIDQAIVRAPLDSTAISLRHLIMSHHYEHRLLYDSACMSMESYLQYIPGNTDAIQRRDLLRACANSTAQKRE